MRVSARSSGYRNVTLRCYADGYYPTSSISMSWYSSLKNTTWIRGECIVLPFTDGTYRLTCDFHGPMDFMYEPLCRVDCNASDFHVTLSLSRNFDNRTLSRAPATRILFLVVASFLMYHISISI